MAHLASQQASKMCSSQPMETNMTISLGITLYFSLGLALSQLRLSQGLALGDALFSGVFWPFDLMRRGIELLVRVLVQTDAA